MRNFAVKLALLMTAICFSCAARAQDDGAMLVQQAARCLAAKGFIPHTEVKKLTLGYLLDDKSYPDKKLLYVVNYPNPSRPDGFAFTLFLKTGESPGFRSTKQCSLHTGQEWKWQNFFHSSAAGWNVDPRASCVYHQADSEAAEVDNSGQGHAYDRSFSWL